MKIAILGTGHVGLVSGACFASRGHQVVCVDLDAGRVESINRARAPFFEQGLPELLQSTVGHSLRATLDVREAVLSADVTILAVGTPFDGTGLDLRQIREAARAVGEVLRERRDSSLVMVKSTVLPGTTDQVVRPILEQASGRRAGVDFGLAMNPEFLREGQAVADFLQPDRVVMGGIDERSWRMQEELYRNFPTPDVLLTDNATAEMIKYTANSLLATLISFSNEIANVSATVPGVDIADVMRGVHLDKRLSPILETPNLGGLAASGERLRPGILTYLMAGCGFGGSCLPKDIQSLIAFGDAQGSPMQMLRSVHQVNVEQPSKLVEMARRHLVSLEGASIAILGLAFKPGTSDIRETPALPVIESLRRQGARLRLYDPAATQEIEKLIGSENLFYTEDLEAAIEGAAVLIVLTSWPELRRLPDLVKALPEPPLVIDGRRMFEKGDFARYDGIGLGPAAGS